ncbi:AMP-binding protein [Pelagibius sp.]|uniref:AMP-binding protein n=1 Tax=Pelagibius sp. TaxID=1931238 RepID=UPI003BAFE84E
MNAVLASFEQVRNSFPEIPETIVEALDRTAARYATEEAVVEGGSRVTFGKLKKQADQVASALAAKGFKEGDHIGVCVGNGVEWIELFAGIVRLGAVCVPINTRLKPDEIAYQLKQADVAALFITERLLSIDFIEVLRLICPEVDTSLPSPKLPRLRQVIVLGNSAPNACQTLDDFFSDGGQDEMPPPPEPDDPALIQYTSGTTSFPKGVVLTHRNMVTDAYFAGQCIGVQAGDRYLSARPFFHVAGSTLSVVLSLVTGATLVTMKRFIADEALRLLEDERCTLTSGNDTMYLMLLNSPDFAPGCYRLRGGWAAVSPSIMRRITGEFDAGETVVAYGLSEASPNVAMSDHQDPLEDRVAGWMNVHPGLQVRITDPENGVQCAIDEEGEIQVQGWCVMQGYYNDPEATAKTMTADGFLRTGDKGTMRKDLKLRFVGRLKEIIRVGGENVAPSDIEDALVEHPKIQQAQVFALPDPRLIEVPGAYVLLRQGETLTEDDVAEWAKCRLANFKIPKYIAIVESFESIGMTASSKIPKRLLAEHAKKLFGLEDS